MNTKLLILSLILCVLYVNSSLLPMGRYDSKKNTNNKDFNLIEEFTVCGMDSTQMQKLLQYVRQGDIDKSKRNWKRHVKILSGADYKNEYQTYTGCEGDGTMMQFGIALERRKQNLRRVAQQLTSFGLKQVVSCIDEVMMRSFLNTAFGTGQITRKVNEGPKLVRMVYHDSVDFNNLVDVNNTDYTGRSGVDYCLHAPITAAGKSGKSAVTANPQHNRGLRPSMRFVRQNGRRLRSWASLPDVMVLGSIVAIESWFQGPKINFQFGRKKGKCTQILCEQGAKNCHKSKLFLKTEPVSHHWTNTQNQKVFAHLGFTPKESISLMGAHTIGGVNTCTGFGPLNNGPYCSKEKNELDRGSFFDETPGLFDNNYFKILNNISLTEKDLGIKPIIDCRRLRRINRQKPDFFQNVTCKTLTYCNMTGGRKSHMKDMNTLSYVGDQERRIVQLPADWNNLFDPETAQHIKHFANDQKDFFDTFAKSYEKVSNMGYSADQLKQCRPTECQLSKDQTGFECQNEFSDYLTFDVNTNSECQTTGSEEANCRLVSAYGVKGEIQCDNGVFTCPIRQSEQNKKSQDRFKSQQRW